MSPTTRSMSSPSKNDIIERIFRRTAVPSGAETSKAKDKDENKDTPETQNKEKKAIVRVKSPTQVLKYPLMTLSTRLETIPTFFRILNATDNPYIDIFQNLDDVQKDLEVMLTSIVKRNRLIQNEILGIREEPLKIESSTSSNESKEEKGKNIRIERATVLKRDKKRSVDTSRRTARICSKERSIDESPTEDESEEETDEEDDVTTSENGSKHNRDFFRFVDECCRDIKPRDVSLLERLVRDCEATHRFLPSLPKTRNGFSEKRLSGEGNERVQGEIHEDENKNKSSDNGPITRQRVSRAVRAKPREKPFSRRTCSPKPRANGGLRARKGFTRMGKPFTRSQAHVPDAHDTTTSGPEEESKRRGDAPSELMRSQLELHRINSWNHQQLLRLLESSRLELSRQEVKKEIEIVDERIKEHLRLKRELRKGNKQLSRKQRETIWNDLKRRSFLIEKLNHRSRNDT